jgi:hypothetical protein
MFKYARLQICLVGNRLVKKVWDSCTQNGLEPFFCNENGTSCDNYFMEHRNNTSLRQAFPGFSSGTIFDSVYNLYSHEQDFVSWSYDRKDYGQDVKR